MHDIIFISQCITMEQVRDFFVSIGVPVEGNRLLETLENIGVRSIEHLCDVKQEDLVDAGITLIDQRRIIRLIRERLSSSSTPGFTNSPLETPLTRTSLRSFPVPIPTSFESAPTPTVEEHYVPPALKQKRSKIYYIFCKDLFGRNVMREVITNLDLELDSLELIARMISERHKFRLDTYAIEFYSHEGYPMCVNQYNVKFTLAQWKIRDESLVYAFARPKSQSVWIKDSEETNNEYDPLKGADSIRIYSQLFGNFTVKVDLKDIKLESLKGKVSVYTGVPTKFIELYQEAERYHKLKEYDELDIEDNDQLFLRIEGAITPLYATLGKKSYNPVQAQTDRGYAKFYTILKYLTCSQKEVHQKFLSSILRFSECPPLAYAFHLLFQHKSVLSLTHMVALFEGFFQLSCAVLEYFCDEIEPEKCFEFCDYIFGLILKFAKANINSTRVKTETLSLQCPISGRQILNPVMVPQSDSVYERFYVEERVKQGLGLPQCTCNNVELGDIRPAQKYERLLMFAAFSDADNRSSTDFDVWTSTFEPQKEISPIMISCTWKELNEAIKLLNIKAPNDLASLKYCITFIDKGQFAFYTEPAKSLEQQLHVYDPVKQKEITYKKEEMETFASDWKSKACHKLTNYLNPKIKASLSVTEAKDSSVIGDKQKLTEIRETPEEAIMVLVDCSGSMSKNIFESECSTPLEQYSKLTAAKELFFAFANRSDAYGFNHAIGLITFSTSVCVKVTFTQVMDYFKDVIGEMKTGGLTVLHDALSEAADKLTAFVVKYPNCHKRVICLTDGVDNGSKIRAHEITRRLQREKIVVDTVLITASGNVDQKAISHATGGFCFLPSNLQDATRLFEMEQLLRLQDRPSPYPARRLVSSKEDLGLFKRLSEYPYNSTNIYEFKANFIANIDQMESISAKKMVNLATFMGQMPSSMGIGEESVRRVVLEAKNYIHDPHPSVEIFPGKSSVLQWKILLKGPDECPYEGGVFLLLAKFPNEYPSKPPEIRFVTPIYHCNINSSGRICHPILGRNYIPCMTMRSIIDNIYGLLMAPEPLDPLDSVLASQYHDSRAVYESQATEHTKKYAKNLTWDELKKELTKDEDDDVAEGLVCPLTNKLFVDPVLTPHGFTYERSALLEYMKKNGNRDPQAHKPIRVADLVPQRDIKKLADKLRKSSFRQ